MFRPLRPRTLVVAATLLAMVLTPGSAASKQRIEFLNGTSGVRDLPGIERAEASQPRSGAIVQVQGVAQTSRRADTIRVGKSTVRISPSTAIESPVQGHAEAALNPRALSGRLITVIGRRSGGAIDATLVLVRPASHEIRGLKLAIEVAEAQQRWIKPAGDGSCGEFRRGAPE